MDKMTNAKAVNYVLENVADLPAEVREKLVAIKASFERKSVNRKPTKTQVANEGLKDVILEVLENYAKPVTVTEILASGKFEQTTSNQKISSLLKQLVDAQLVVKTVDKKTSLFSIAVKEVEEVEEEVAE